MSTYKPFVVAKEAVATRVETLNLSSYLPSGETIVSVTQTSVAPSTSPLLTATLESFTATTLTASYIDGLANTTYAVKYAVTPSASAAFTVTVAVSIVDDIRVPYVTKNPAAYQNLIDSIEAGDAAVGKVFYTYPAGTSFTGASATWDLLDENGSLLATGNAFDYRVTTTSLKSVLEASAVVHIPSELPASLSGYKYQIRWSLIGLNGSTTPVYSFESIKVLGKTTAPQGVEDMVEMQGDVSETAVVLPRVYDYVGVEVYSGNTLATPYTPATLTGAVNGGYHYSVELPTSSYTSSLDPLTVSWKYKDSVGLTYRETGKLFVVNASMLQAVEDSRSLVMKAGTTLFQLEDMLFSTPVILGWLRRGRDMFNAAAGVLTYFDMTNATGGLREFWLRYSEIGLLRSQYLAEGEKSFNFQGQAISLDVDRTQYYQGLADSLQQQLDNDVKPFKQNLLKKGISGGDGDVTAASRNPYSTGRVGIGSHPLTNNPWAWTGIYGLNR